MSDYIDRDLIKQFPEWKTRGYAHQESINSLPSIDAVPVIRCKDCRHYKPSEVAERMMCFRKDADGIPVCYDFLPDDWCKYGERKEDE